MKIYVVGTGYVGLVTGACFAAKGNEVTCIDVDARKIEHLRNGVLPIYEPGLDTLVTAAIQAGTLQFATSLAETLAQETPDAVFIAVGTPSDEDGSADLQYVLSVAREVGRFLTARTLVVDKSTVPVGTADLVSQAIAEELSRRNVALEFEVVSNPEFLKEGAAIDDFMNPDRIVIGAASAHAREVLTRLYEPFVSGDLSRIHVMHRRDAEMTKYAANAMLALRITFMNELAVLCDALHVDIDKVRQGIGADTRIGPHALYAGCGFGGSCFPKDVRALIYAGEQAGVSLNMLKSVEARNASQKRYLADKIVSHYGTADLTNKTFAVLGLAFKAGTDDVRESPALEIIQALLEKGAAVQVFDPVAAETGRQALALEGVQPGAYVMASSTTEALSAADALVVVTDWAEFKQLTIEQLQGLTDKVVFDGRNIFNPVEVKAAGLTYYGIGRQ